MIVMSAGLQKCGSGLYFNLTNDLLIAAGKEDVRAIKERFKLENILQHYNCNISNLSENNLNYLLSIHETGKTFVVKTHMGPTKFLEILMKKGIVKASCIYRDPRDVVLSAMDHGEKIRKKGETHTFASCSSIEKTIKSVKTWLDNIMRWFELDDVLLVKFENLIEKPIEQLERLAKFLEIDTTNIDLELIYSKYDIEKLDDFQKDYLHFNIGNTGRFRTIMEEKDLNMCNKHFFKYFEKMGYST